MNSEERAEITAERARSTAPVEPLVSPGQCFSTPIPCPECGGETEIEIDEYFTGSRKPTPYGFRLMCSAEEREFEAALDENREPEWEHDHWQSSWQAAIDRAYSWMIKSGIRVSG